MLLGILQSQAAGGGATYEHLTTFSPGTASSWSINGLDAYSDYTHLHITATLQAQRNEVLFMKFNNDTGNNYSMGYIRGGDGSSANASAANYYDAGAIEFAEVMARNSEGVSIMSLDILDFRSTTKQKSLRGLTGQSNATRHRIAQGLGSYQSTNAIDSIQMSIQGNYASTSETRFSIYGIRG